MPEPTSSPWDTRLKVRLAVGVGFVLIGAITFIGGEALDWWIGVIWVVLGLLYFWDVNRVLRKRSVRPAPDATHR